MGIKDNFSQAVKELWKKDGKDGDNKGEAQSNQGGQSSASELDRYLREQNYTKDGAVLNADDYSDGGVPLETPYYPNTDASARSAAQAEQPEPTRPSQPTQPTQSFQSGADTNARAPQGQPMNNNTLGEDNNQGYNQNVRRAQGQSVQNSQSSYDQGGYNQGGYNNQGYNNQGGYGGYGGQNYGGSYNGGLGGGANNGGYGGNPPAGAPIPERSETDEITVISKNTMIDGNVRSLANMQIDGNIKGNVETTKNIDMSGKIIGDVTCNNAGMIAAAMQGNVSLKGRMRMDRDTILIGDLSSQYADINGRIRGKLDIVGKAELKRDAVVFGDINASTIAVTDGAIIQGYVNTTFLSKEDSRNVFPDAISIDSKEVKS